MSQIPDFKALVDDIFDGELANYAPLVEVHWLDAEDIAVNWADKDDVERSCPAPSLAVGYLFCKDKTCVKVVPLVNHSHCGNGITIPMGMVKKITYLTRKK